MRCRSHRKEQLALSRLLLSCVLLALAGCSDGDHDFEKLLVHPVSGKLTVNGKPAADALLYFHRTEEIPHAEIPIGKVQDDGTFSLTTYQPNDGAPIGDYVITIQWPKDPASGPLSGDRLKNKFTNPKTSTLTATIDEGDNILPPIKLTGVQVETEKSGTMGPRDLNAIP